MTKHSKHGNGRPFSSQAERSRTSFQPGSGSVTSESHLPFGFCCISLKPPKCPVANSQGWIFDKDCVVEYIVSQRVIMNDPAGHYKEDNAEKLARESTVNLAQLSIRDATKVQAVKNSFWLSPDAQSNTALPVVNPQKSSRSERFVKCPMSGAKLRLKDLVKIHFDSATEKEADEGIYCCALTKRPIGHQQALLLKPSGRVVLETVFKISTDGSECPLTGAKLESSDIIKLHRGRPIHY